MRPFYRILCLLWGHRWHTVLVNMPKFRNLLHLHPQAGCWSVCTRCWEEWNDLYWHALKRCTDRWCCGGVIVAPPELQGEPLP